MDSQAATAFSNARSSLLLDHFFFGRLAMYLKPVQRDDIPTLAVDGKHLFYKPEFFLGLSPVLRKSAIAHEVMHCVFEHIVRRRGRDPRLWNVAGDYVINHALVEAGLKIGDTWLHSKAFAGMSADEIYELLKQDGKEQGDPLCDILDAPQATGAPDDAATAEMQHEWATNVAQTAVEAARMGQLPKSLQRVVDDITSNKVPWREVLHRFVTERVNDDYSWARPNRMFVAFGAYLPSLYSEGMGHLDVVIDTSGSITRETLNTFGAEIKAIVAAVRPTRLRVIYADAAVNHVDEFLPGEEPVFNMHGGGGTDFRPAIAQAGEEPPAALVYLTDMYGAFPSEAPEFPVLWVATTHVEAPWGQTVRMRD